MQGPQKLGLEAFIGSLAGFSMLALVGDLIDPLPRLCVDVGQIGESSQAAASGPSL
jgi:hypothetical protein